MNVNGIIIKYTFTFLLLSITSASAWCYNKTEKLNLHNLIANFYDSKWFINQPSSYMDESVKFENEPSLFLSGYYSSASLTNNNIDPKDSILVIKGHVRIDSLVGEVDIAVRCWSGSSRKKINHVGEFHKILSCEEPGQWQEFKIVIPLCLQMQEFDFEIKIKGAGCIWVGDINAVSVKYTSGIYNSPSRQCRQQRYGHDRSYDNQKHNLSLLQVTNLTILGKIWGFLKYFHPNVRNGTMDWDAELFRMIPLIMNADTVSRNELLLEWCNGLGTFNISKDSSILNSNDAVKWIKDTLVFGQKLSRDLQKTVMADRSPYHSYLYQVPHVMTIDDKNEKTYPQMSYSDMNLKLLAVFRIWNYVQYFYPYRHLLDTSWDKALDMAVPAMFEVDNENEYKNVLSAIGVFTNDSHTYSAHKPKNIFKLLRNMTRIPSDMQYAAPFLTTKYHDSSYYVTWAFRESEQDLVKGDAIIAMNGEYIDDYINRNGSLLASSNDSRKQRDLALSVSTSQSKFKTYTVVRNNDTITLSPQLMPFKEFRRKAYRSGIRQATMTWFNGMELHAFDTINDSTAYLHAENMTLDDFKKALNYNRIIVDLRNYPMNMSHLWLMSLLPEVKPIAIVSYPDILNPGIFHTMTSDMTGVGRFYNPDRKIALLVNEYTQSSAEYTAMTMQSSPQVAVIGSTTAGANGNVVQLSLPGEYVFQIAGIGIKYPNGNQVQRCGIKIDYPISCRPDDISDCIIEYALALLDLEE